MDILGPLPTTHDGNQYILVFSAFYMRWPEAFALPSVEASRIAQLLVDEILAWHSAPRTLLSDRCPNFPSSVIQSICQIMNTRLLHTTAYHPQTDGLVERFNATLCEGLSIYVSTHQKDWDKHLPLVLFAYCVSPNATTSESPFYLLYGREPRLLLKGPIRMYERPCKRTQRTLPVAIEYKCFLAPLHWSSFIDNAREKYMKTIGLPQLKIVF